MFGYGLDTPLSLVANEVYYYIANTHEKSTKNQSVTEWYRYGKCRAMDKNLSTCVATKSKLWNTLNYLV